VIESSFLRKLAADCFFSSAVWLDNSRLFLVLLILVLFTPSLSLAHFNLNTNIRIIHLEQKANGILVSMRLPAPLVFSEYVAIDDSQDSMEIPFVESLREEGEWNHYLNIFDLSKDDERFAKFIAAGYSLQLNGKSLSAQPIKIRLHNAAQQPRFTNLLEVERAFLYPNAISNVQKKFVSDIVIDIRILYQTNDLIGEIEFSNTLDSRLPRDTFIANLIINHIGEKPRVSRIEGQLIEPIVINPTMLGAARTFITHGIQHILSGWDHVLFVLCLTIGAVSITGLLWRVTGFTLGHTITIIAGFYEYVPKSPWFIPLVEILIALSIIYAALAALIKVNNRTSFIVTSAIGLLHGFGFSLLLSDILAPGSSHLLISLLSFNIGIEIGQVLIVVSGFLIIMGISRFRESVKNTVIRSFAGSSIFIASYWVYARAEALY
jgi:hypothetical protein